MDIDKVRKAAALMREAQDLLSHGPLDFYLTEMAAAYDILMTRYAPFKVGDRVRLKDTPDINEAVRYGWLACKSLLVAGATGVIVRADCGSYGFFFGVVFDADPAARKRHFSFSDGDLEAERI